MNYECINTHAMQSDVTSRRKLLKEKYFQGLGMLYTVVISYELEAILPIKAVDKNYTVAYYVYHAIALCITAHSVLCSTRGV